MHPSTANKPSQRTYRRPRRRPHPSMSMELEPMPMPLPRVARRFCAIGLALLVLWVFAVLAGPVVVAAVGAAGDGQAPGFADARRLWNIPNALDVLSNLGFLVAGALGLAAYRRVRAAQHTRRALWLFFAGLVLTALGSAAYHWTPGELGLALDRTGMAVAFSGALALAVAERVGQQASALTWRLVLVAALLSAVLPFAQDNVLPWAVVQFGGLALLVWLVFQKRTKTAMGIPLCAIVVWYVLAKLLELNDAAIFHATGEWVSGHSLKHLAAALAAWPVLRAVRQNAQASKRQEGPAAA